MTNAQMKERKKQLDEISKVAAADHDHKWIEKPCGLTGAWTFWCECGAERMLEMDQDGTATETIVEAGDDE